MKEYYSFPDATSLPDAGRMLIRDGLSNKNITGALLKSQILESPVITGQMTVPAGSASAPSMSTAGDTNTGIYFPAADTVGIATGGGDRLRITPTGNLLIGTSTDDGLNKLQVGGYILAATSGTGQSRILASNDNGIALLGVESVTGGSVMVGTLPYDAVLRYESGKGLCIGYENLVAARFTSTGNVLIGTTTDNGSGAKLQVNGSGKFTGNLTLDGSARRIIADFSNSVLSNRTMFKTSATNGNTSVRSIPDGTSTTSSFGSYNNSNADNSGIILMVSSDTNAFIQSTRTGTAAIQPLSLRINTVDHHMLTTSGNTVLKTGVGASDDDGVNKLQVTGGIKSDTLKLTGLAVYADNAAALAGGLVAGTVYRTSTGVLMVAY